jgi:hypothetical protein
VLVQLTRSTSPPLGPHFLIRFHRPCRLCCHDRLKPPSEAANSSRTFFSFISFSHVVVLRTDLLCLGIGIPRRTWCWPSTGVDLGSFVIFSLESCEVADRASSRSKGSTAVADDSSAFDSSVGLLVLRGGRGNLNFSLSSCNISSRIFGLWLAPVFAIRSD